MVTKTYWTILVEISSRNFPTLVPPYFWITHGRSSVFERRAESTDIVVRKSKLFLVSKEAAKVKGNRSCDCFYALITSR
jgi:hypothetical protein